MVLCHQWFTHRSVSRPPSNLFLQYLCCMCVWCVHACVGVYTCGPRKLTSVSSSTTLHHILLTHVNMCIYVFNRFEWDCVWCTCMCCARVHVHVCAHRVKRRASHSALSLSGLFCWDRVSQWSWNSAGGPSDSPVSTLVALRQQSPTCGLWTLVGVA